MPSEDDLDDGLKLIYNFFSPTVSKIEQYEASLAMTKRMVRIYFHILELEASGQDSDKTVGKLVIEDLGLTKKNRYGYKKGRPSTASQPYIRRIGHPKFQVALEVGKLLDNGQKLSEAITTHSEKSGLTFEFVSDAWAGYKDVIPRYKSESIFRELVSNYSVEELKHILSLYKKR